MRRSVTVYSSLPIPIAPSSNIFNLIDTQELMRFLKFFIIMKIKNVKKRFLCNKNKKRKNRL